MNTEMLFLTLSCRLLLCLCSYIALSAWKSKSSIVNRGIRFHPNDPQTERQGISAFRLKVIGIHITLQTCLHTGQVAFGCIDVKTTNSSPPMRPITSESRKVSVKMRANWVMAISPPACPNVSLIFFRLSRSIYIRQMDDPPGGQISITRWQGS